jgi:hypothetical protein
MIARDLTAERCPARPSGDDGTHHLIPRGRRMVCAHCGTEQGAGRITLNEAGLDVVANRLLGFGMFDQNSKPTPDALSALSGSRAALRKLVKAAARMARDEIEAER